MPPTAPAHLTGMNRPEDQTGPGSPGRAQPLLVATGAVSVVVGVVAVFAFLGLALGDATLTLVFAVVCAAVAVPLLARLVAAHLARPVSARQPARTVAAYALFAGGLFAASVLALVFAVVLALIFSLSMDENAFGGPSALSNAENMAIYAASMGAGALVFLTTAFGAVALACRVLGPTVGDRA